MLIRLERARTRWTRAAIWVSSLTVLLALIVTGTGRARAACEQPAAGPVNAAGVSIDAGGPGDGGSFAADEYYSGGAEASNTTGSNGNITFSRTVSHPIPQADWNTYRFLASTYTIPGLTPGGVYQVRLYFLDWYWTKTGQRVFNVNINGQPALTNFDIVQAAVNAGGDGQYIGVEKDFAETADAAGDITISFIRGSADQPMINAIAVAPSS